MAPRKLRKAIGAVKDQTSISLAKVGTSPSLSDLEVAILKATRHEEHPADEKHIREILSLTSYSRVYVGASVSIISRRLNKTRNWTVAAKTLMLIQRLLWDGDPAYEQEIFFATRRGTRLLNMSDFRDSRTGIWDYSAFVRTYAMYLDQRLEYRMQSRRGRQSGFRSDSNEGGKSEEKERGSSANCARSSPVREMENEDIFCKVQHSQQVLDRFLACRPAGLAKTHRVVLGALYQTLKESFHVYYDISELLSTLIDRFMELEMNGSIKVYETFRRVAKQFEELESFYEWCKIVGVLRSSEFPEVEKITQKKLDIMDEYIRDKSSYTDENGEGTEMTFEKPEPEEDTNTTEASPAPEPEPVPEPEPPVEAVEEAPLVVVEPKPKQTEGDLLNLGEDAQTTEKHANSLALALFDCAAAPSQSPPLPWEAFKDTKDWETALVQSASNLSHQRAEPGGGFDILMLEGMYQKGANVAAMTGPGYGTTGSASSMALGSAGRPVMLALPAPPSTDGHPATGSDPFVASLAMAPPAYVQMSDMEKKQKLLTEEQMLWVQHQRDGMQGHLHQHAYRSGGYGY